MDRDTVKKGLSSLVILFFFIGTSTNADGNYSLTVPDTSNVLVFSFIGFQTQEIQIDGRTQIDVALETRVYSAGEEIVVVGYGTQQKSDLTGSVGTMKAEHKPRDLFYYYF